MLFRYYCDETDILSIIIEWDFIVPILSCGLGSTQRILISQEIKMPVRER